MVVMAVGVEMRVVAAMMMARAMPMLILPMRLIIVCAGNTVYAGYAGGASVGANDEDDAHDGIAHG